MSNPTVGQFRAIWQGILDRLSGQAGKAQVQDADVKDAIDALRQTELFGESLSDRPPANSVSVGTTFMVVGDTVVYQSNGEDWVVISE